MFKVLFDGFDSHPGARFATVEAADAYRLANLSSAQYHTCVVPA